MTHTALNELEKGDSMNHTHVFNSLKEKFEADPRVKGLILFGSFSRGEHVQGSDIDLWVIKETDYFTRSHEIHDGVTVEM